MDFLKRINSTKEAVENKSQVVMDDPDSDVVFILYISEAHCKEISEDLVMSGVKNVFSKKRVGEDFSGLEIPSGVKTIIIEANPDELSDGDSLNNFLRLCSDFFGVGCMVIVISTIDKLSLSINIQRRGFNYQCYPNSDVGTNGIVQLANQGASNNVISKRKGRVVCFIGAKGGVGCTLIATQIAFFISKKINKNVYYINVGSSRNSLDIFFGNKSASPSKVNTKNLLEIIDFDAVNDVITHTINDKLKLIDIKDEFGGDTSELKRKLTAVMVENSDFVLCDMSSPVSEIDNILLRDYCNVLVVVSDTTFPSQRELSRVVSELTTKTNAKIVNVMVNKNKGGVFSQKNFSGEISGVNVDVTIPFDQSIDDRIIDKEDLFLGNLTGASIESLAKIIMGYSFARTNANFFEKVKNFMSRLGV